MVFWGRGNFLGCVEVERLKGVQPIEDSNYGVNLDNWK